MGRLSITTGLIVRSTFFDWCDCLGASAATSLGTDEQGLLKTCQIVSKSPSFRELRFVSPKGCSAVTGFSTACFTSLCDSSGGTGDSGEVEEEAEVD
jgi:hypothetical protein